MGASSATELWAAEAGIERGLGGAGTLAAGAGLQVSTLGLVFACPMSLLACHLTIFLAGRCVD